MCRRRGGNPSTSGSLKRPPTISTLTSRARGFRLTRGVEDLIATDRRTTSTLVRRNADARGGVHVSRRFDERRFADLSRRLSPGVRSLSRVRECFTRRDRPYWTRSALAEAEPRGVWWRAERLKLMWPLAVVVLSGVELNFAEHRPREAAEDLDLLSRPVSGLVVDRAESAEHLSVGAEERRAGVGDHS
jgi:hypothetical protein